MQSCAVFAVVVRRLKHACSWLTQGLATFKPTLVSLGVHSGSTAVHLTVITDLANHVLSLFPVRRHTLTHTHAAQLPFVHIGDHVARWLWQVAPADVEVETGVAPSLAVLRASRERVASHRLTPTAHLNSPLRDDGAGALDSPNREVVLPSWMSGRTIVDDFITDPSGTVELLPLPLRMRPHLSELPVFMGTPGRVSGGSSPASVGRRGSERVAMPPEHASTKKAVRRPSAMPDSRV